MKKKLGIFLFCALAVSTYTKSPKEIIIAENQTKEFTVNGESHEKNAAVYSRKKLILEKGTNLNVKGKIEKGEKPIVAINTIDKYGQNYLTIKENANLNVDVKLENTSVHYPNQPLVGIKTYGSRGGIEIEKGGNLNIIVHSNKPLAKQSNINAPHKDNKDLFHQLYNSSVGLELGQDLNSKGRIDIESTGWGISYNDKKIPKKLDFENGSETNIKAGLIGIYQPKDGTTVNFKKGSYTKLISGIYGLVARKAIFESGSKIDAYGKYGLGNFEYKGAGDKYFFKKGSEVNILANHSALYGISLQEGSAKVNAKAKNILHTVDTRKGATQTLDTFTFDNGSILEGNIVESWSSKIKLDEEAKLFVNDEIDTNLIAKGDIYVGPRTAYENVENKVYKEEVKKQLGDVDAVVGASVILMGEHSKVNLDDLKTDELDDHYGKPRDIHPFPEVDPDKYYTVRFNDYDYNSEDRKIKVDFDNAKIHLRLGKEKDGRINDKLFFSKIATVGGEGAKIIIHKGNDLSEIRQTTSIDWLEEDLTGKSESSLEKLKLAIDDIDFGKYSFTKRMGRTGNKFVVSSLYKGISNDAFTKKFTTPNIIADEKEDGNMIGNVNLAKGKTSSAIGSHNVAKNGASAVGRVNTAEGNFSSAFGGNNTASGEGSSAFGTTNTASGIHSVAFGNGNTSKGEKSSTFGVGNTVTGEMSTVIGYKNTVNGNNNFVLGSNVNIVAGMNNVVVLGNESTAGSSNTVSVGSATNQRRIVFVGDGVNDTDAVNMGQFKNANDIDINKWKTKLGVGMTSGGSVDLLSYYDKTKVDEKLNKKLDKTAFDTRMGKFADATATDIDMTAWKSRLGIGSAPAGSNVINTVESGTTGGTGLGHDNVVTGNFSTAIGYKNKVTGNNSGAFGDPNYVSGNRSYAFGNDNNIAGDDNFVLGSNVNIGAEIKNSVALGNKSTVSSSNEVSVGSATQKRKITNVADGEVSATSTDAVNGRQLYEVSRQVGAEAIKEVKKDISNVKEEARGIGSLSAALSALHPMQYDEKAPNQIMAGVGSYGDKQAVAVGLTHYFKENVMMTAGVALSNESKTNAMANLGLTWKLGKAGADTQVAPTHVMSNELRRVTKENSDLKTKVQSQDERIKNLEQKLEMLLKNK